MGRWRDRLRASQTRTGRRTLLGEVPGPLRRYLATESGSAGILFAVVVLALAWANSPWSRFYESLWATPISVQVADARIGMDLGHWINDGLMTLFFFVIGLEVRREFSMGELTRRRRAVVPVAAGLGGMAVPAAAYLAVNPLGPAAGGWGVVIGTDTAFLLGALALLGPRRSTQLRLFLLTVTVVDDIVAVTVIGVVYSDSIHLPALVVAAVCLVLLTVLSRLNVWRAAAYIVLVVALWISTVEAGLHASIAGMAAGLLVAARPPQREQVEGAASLFRAFRQSPMPSVGYSAKQGLARAISVNERVQTVLHPWTSFLIVPLFALSNAGVDLRGGVLADALSSPVTWAVVAGLTAGKLIGVGLGALGAAGAGLGRLPQGVGPGQVLGGAALSGIGFTVSLLIADLAFDDPVLRDEATVGVLLAGILSAALGWLLFWVAAEFRGERTAALPLVLDRAVEADRDHIRGPADAPLTLVEYGDFECPFCAKATGLAGELRQRFGQELRYVFRHLPLPDVHPRAELASRAAEAAAAQDRFWDMHDHLFANQDDLEYENLVRYAAELELDLDRFVRDLDDDRWDGRIREDVSSAEASGARGTPTFFVGDRRHVGPHDAGSLASELEALRWNRP